MTRSFRSTRNTRLPNTVYERFFQGYSVKLADTMGIVHTPQEIVDFMCGSVAEVLDKDFGKKLWRDAIVPSLSPRIGTGTIKGRIGLPTV